MATVGVNGVNSAVDKLPPGVGSRPRSPADCRLKLVWMPPTGDRWPLFLNATVCVHHVSVMRAITDPVMLFRLCQKVRELFWSIVCLCCQWCMANILCVTYALVVLTGASPVVLPGSIS